MNGKWGNCPTSLVCGTGSTSFVSLNLCFYFLGPQRHLKAWVLKYQVLFPGTKKQATRDLVASAVSAAEKKCVCGQGVEQYDIKTFKLERIFFLGLLCLASKVCSF